MRFLSIAALSGLLATAVYAHNLENRDTHLAGRADCGPGQQPNKNKCEDCTAGSFSTGGNTACQPCPADKYSDTNGASTCTACPTGTHSTPGATKCTSSCSAGQYWSGSQCSTCPAGYYSQAGALSCSICPAGTYSSAGAPSCNVCPVGLGSPAGSTSIIQCVNVCPPGQVNDGSGCEDCPKGTFQFANQCVDCPPGTIAKKGSTMCHTCDPGWIPTPSDQTCRKCPKDTFSNGIDCLDCPAGTTSQPGSTYCTGGPSGLPRVRRGESCSPGLVSCPVLAGMGGYECLNPMITLDSCGGCVPIDGEEGPQYTGRDCSAIPNVDEVNCNMGRCHIQSCRTGYEPSGDSCVPQSSSGTLHSRSAHGRFSRLFGL